MATIPIRPRIALDVVTTNPQEPEKPAAVQIDSEGRVLIDVNGDPWHTIQGEGPFAGRPAFFVRLAGCNLQCPECDTDYTTERDMVPVSQIVADLVTSRVNSHPNTTLVVVTGGEPFRQAAFCTLAVELMIAGFEVQVETNGSLWINDFPVFNPLLTIVCSPKTPTINPNILKYADAFKYVVRAGDTDEETGLPTNVLGSGLRAAAPPTGVYENGRGGRAFEVYVQGEEDIRSEAQTSANIFHAVRIAMQFGYRVSLQMHKILGLM